MDFKEEILKDIRARLSDIIRLISNEKEARNKLAQDISKIASILEEKQLKRLARQDKIVSYICKILPPIVILIMIIFFLAILVFFFAYAFGYIK